MNDVCKRGGCTRPCGIRLQKLSNFFHFFWGGEGECVWQKIIWISFFIPHVTFWTAPKVGSYKPVYKVQPAWVSDYVTKIFPTIPPPENTHFLGNKVRQRYIHQYTHAFPFACKWAVIDLHLNMETFNYRNKVVIVWQHYTQHFMVHMNRKLNVDLKK